MKPAFALTACVFLTDAAPAASAAAPQWDSPFVASLPLMESMDGKSCPIVRVLPISYATCISDLNKCMESDSDSIGTVWYPLSRKDVRSTSLTVLYLSFKGTPVALRMKGHQDPLRLDAEEPLPVSRSVLAESSNRQWLARLTMTTPQLAVSDEFSDTKGMTVYTPLPRSEAVALDSYSFLQGATFSVLKSPVRIQANQSVTLLTSCSP